MFEREKRERERKREKLIKNLPNAKSIWSPQKNSKQPLDEIEWGMSRVNWFKTTISMASMNHPLTELNNYPEWTSDHRRCTRNSVQPNVYVCAQRIVLYSWKSWNIDHSSMVFPTRATIWNEGRIGDGTPRLLVKQPIGWPMTGDRSYLWAVT